MAKGRTIHTAGLGRNDDLTLELGLIVDTTSIDASLAKLKSTIERNVALQNNFANRFRATGETIGASIGRGVSSAERSLRRLTQVGSSAARDLSHSFGNVNRTIASVASSIKFGAGIGVGMSAVDIARKIPDALGKSLASSTELRSIEQRLQRTFGSLSDDARNFAKEFSQQIGTAESTTKTMLARFAATLEQTHIDPKKRSEASKTMARLSSDMAVAWGTSEQDAADAMLAALRGEADPIERYALNLKEAAVSAKLFAMGITGGSRAATESQKVIARLNLIIEQTKNIHGVAATQTGGYTRELNRLSAGWQSLSEKFGKALEPAAAHIAKFAADTIPKLESAAGPLDKFSERLQEASQEWTEALAPLQEQFVGFVAWLPEGLEKAATAVKSLNSTLRDMGELLKSTGLDSLNSDWSEWFRGRARGDDIQAIINGPDAVNATNEKLKDFASTPTHSQEQRDKEIANARMPMLRRMSLAITDAMSWALGVTHGRRATPPKQSVAGPGDPNAPEESPAPRLRSRHHRRQIPERRTARLRPTWSSCQLVRFLHACRTPCGQLQALTLAVRSGEA